MNYHNPVLLQEAVAGLQINPSGVYVDVTYGGGGHSRAILDYLSSEGRLFGFDQDPDAKANCIEDSRFELIPSNFSYMSQFLRFKGVLEVDGILADFGVSSHQFDKEQRGFSTRFDGPLDMRMNPEQALDAAGVVNTYSEAQLSELFYNYGELRSAKKIAKHVVKFRGEKLLNSTMELKNLVAELVPERFLNKTVKVNSVEDFINTMKNSYVFVNRIQRKKAIEMQISKISKKLNLNYYRDDSLLNEVTGLVEFPNVLVGKIDKQYMKLPFEILSIVMKVHQKYFSLVDNSKKMAPYFLVVSNLKPNNQTDKNVVKGNERVLRARLSDALFFWEYDCKNDFSYYLNKLKTMIFYEGLGDLHDRSLRLSKINEKIGPSFNFKDNKKLYKLGLYSKLDLSSNLVGEFPELQGTMLKYLAKLNGFSKDIQFAFEDQYKPVGLNKNMPRNKLGSILSVSNNIDTLSCFFSIGLIPTGSRDPFALRRSGNSLINILWHETNTLSLNQLINSLDKKLSKDVKLVNEIKFFLIDRLYNCCCVIIFLF